MLDIFKCDMECWSQIKYKYKTTSVCVVDQVQIQPNYLFYECTPVNVRHECRILHMLGSSAAAGLMNIKAHLHRMQWGITWLTSLYCICSWGKSLDVEGLLRPKILWKFLQKGDSCLELYWLLLLIIWRIWYWCRLGIQVSCSIESEGLAFGCRNGLV